MLTKTWFTLRSNLTTLAATQIESGKRIELENGDRYLTSDIDGGSGIPLASGNFANPVAVITSFAPISGVITVAIGSDNFITANSTITMPDVTGFTGGEKVSFVGAISMTLTTITVDGTGGEVISSDGQSDDTVFNLTNLPRAGIIFTFIFNAVTGKWEV